MITRAEFLRWLGLTPFFPCPKPNPLDDPWDDPDWLAVWSTAPRHPVTGYEFPPQQATRGVELGARERVLLHAIRHGATLSISYLGGSHPGQVRRISPSGLFTVEGFPALYLSAFCHTRQQPRTFRCDLLEIQS